MSLARVRSGALIGIDGIPVDVEVDIGSGLPDAAVQEARERVRSAIRNSGYEFPLRRITVNLAPADVRKEGPIYDLPIAVAILIASEQVSDRFSETALLGELSLDGRLRHASGVLPLIAMCGQAGRQDRGRARGGPRRGAARGRRARLRSRDAEPGLRRPGELGPSRSAGARDLGRARRARSLDDPGPGARQARDGSGGGRAVTT